MSDRKVVKDVMTGIFEYPHVPYWFTIGQAIRIVKVSFISTKKYPDPLAILVFGLFHDLRSCRWTSIVERISGRLHWGAK